MAEQTRRVFFAALPEPETRAQLLAALAALPRDVGRRSRADNLHLTLAFVGAAEGASLACLRTAARRVYAPEVSMPLERWGCFPKAAVLWLGAAQAPPALLELARSLSAVLAECGFAPETRAFRPHVTLARRVRAVPREAETAPAVFWRSRGFALMESVRGAGGVRYVALERYGRGRPAVS